VKVPNNAFASSFVLKSEKPQWKRINYCNKHMVKMKWVVHKCLTGSDKHSTAQLQQPPYSPDLALCDFFLFPRHKNVLKGHWFEATEDIKWYSTKKLLDIPKEEFAKCFQQWQKRWAKCVVVEGNYVKDN